MLLGTLMLVGQAAHFNAWILPLSAIAMLWVKARTVMALLTSKATFFF